MFVSIALFLLFFKLLACLNKHLCEDLNFVVLLLKGLHFDCDVSLFGELHRGHLVLLVSVLEHFGQLFELFVLLLQLCIIDLRRSLGCKLCLSLILVDSCVLQHFDKACNLSFLCSIGLLKHLDLLFHGFNLGLDLLNDFLELRVLILSQLKLILAKNCVLQQFGHFLVVSLGWIVLMHLHELLEGHVFEVEA